jgi:hypothetical protein
MEVELSTMKLISFLQFRPVQQLNGISSNRNNEKKKISPENVECCQSLLEVIRFRSINWRFIDEGFGSINILSALNLPLSLLASVFN